jgi:transcriptional regulator with XRE-family HTH domain
MPRRQRPALKKARERAGLSQAELAQRIGITRNYVVLVEVGRRNPHLGIMERWATALGHKASFDLFRLEPSDDGAGRTQTKADIPGVA